MPMKTAVITGSTRGIGRAIAEALVARGLRVVITSPDEADARRVAQQWGERAIGIGCDVTSSGEVQRLWDEAVRAFGGVDLWINNAGLALTGSSLVGTREDEFARMLDINVRGTLLGCQVAARGMGAAGGGAIYNMLGAGADGRTVPRMGGYATSKAAVTFLTRSLADELAGGPVLVGGLSPGLVITEGFLREHARTPADAVAGREAVVNLIGDHPETIGRWAAKITDTNRDHGRIFTWLTSRKIRRRQLRPGRDVLSRYLNQPRAE
jgi:NAD(P)-dependent dehydrogenase (short-subunit alcohol dehydrogenase family)